MNLLTPRQRKVWLLRRDGNLSTTEIARLLGVKPQTVDVTLRRVTRKLERAATQGEEARLLLRPPEKAKPTTRFLDAGIPLQ